MNFFTRIVAHGAICAGVLAVFAPPVIAATADPVVDSERKELSGFCDEMKFLDGFAREVDANGDGLADIAVDYSQLSCNGTQMMFCGSGGCTQRIYVQRAGGDFIRVAEFLAYKFEFDRPQDASFLAVMHGGACNRAGAQTCVKRYAIVGNRVAELVPLPVGRWVYRAAPEPAVLLDNGKGSTLRIACDGASLRLHYVPHWLREADGTVSREVADRQKDKGAIAAQVDAGGRETEIRFRIDETARELVSELVPVDGDLVADMKRGRAIVFHHGDSLEHEMSYTLKGSSKALGQLQKACR
jgi:hypothetical protein